MKATWLLALVLAGGSARAGSVEDDLTVVKKAVAPGSQASAGTQTTAGPAGSAEPAPKAAPAQAAPSQENDATRVRARKGKEPQWLRVRVTEKAGTKVSVNLPLALVRAMGDDIPIGLHCGREGKRATLTIGEVLRALDSGQDLVQVDDEDAHVRVWVE
jgi:hypothetical protein